MHDTVSTFPMLRIGHPHSPYLEPCYHGLVLSLVVGGAWRQDPIAGHQQHAAFFQIHCETVCSLALHAPAVAIKLLQRDGSREYYPVTVLKGL
jgi:hypothetical protein